MSWSNRRLDVLSLSIEYVGKNKTCKDISKRPEERRLPIARFRGYS